MRRSILVLGLICAMGCEYEFQQDPKGFVVTRGDTFVRVQPNGVITAGIEGGPDVEWGVAFWMEKGYIEQKWSGGAAQVLAAAKGRLAYEARFVRDKEELPVSLSQTVQAAGEGAHIEYTISGAEICRNLSWCLRMDLASMKGHRLWPRPGRAYRLGAFVNAAAPCLVIELAPGRGLELQFQRAHAMWSSPGGKDNSQLYIALAPAGMRDKPATIFGSISLRFVDIPAVIPGDVQGMYESLAIHDVKPSATRLRRFETLEIAVDLSATYLNPFDPDDIALDAIITSPSGRRVDLPGFYMVDFRRKVVDGCEILELGRGGWCLRFTPPEVGQYTYRVRVRDRSGMLETPPRSFTVLPGEKRGFIRASTTDPRYLEFDNGSPFFAIGHNLPTYHISGQLADDALRRMAAAGENYNRWWMYSRALGLEWEDNIGWYRQDEAWRLDHALDVAQELAIYYMLCLDTHQDFMDKQSWYCWHVNPFNTARGGPCDEPAKWFSNAEAKKAYKNRLRYIVARWSHSPHILAWEFGNEFEGFPGEVKDKLAWHTEMAEYLKKLDPVRHPITTSFWGKTGPTEFWDLPTMDIVQTHCYTNNDNGVAEQVAEYCRTQAESYAKPHIFGEFGIRSHSTTADKDPEGWALHNAFWTGLMSGAAGVPMPWWHENYIDPLNLYFHFTSIRNFVADLSMSRARWRKLDHKSMEFQDKTHPPKILDLKVVPLATGWEKSEPNVFTIQRDGAVSDRTKLRALLHGQAHRDLKNPPTFQVDYPKEGRFLVHVGTVSSGGLLKFWLDGELVAEHKLPCGEGLEKESQWVEQWKLWQTTYDRDFGIEVPAGKHEIRVENTGADWVGVNHYRLTEYHTIEGPDALVLGLQNDEMAIVWIHNRESTWLNHAAKKTVAPVEPSILTITGLMDGPQRLEWWETWKGAVMRVEQVDVVGGVLSIHLPEIATDIALRLLPPTPETADK
ncbi:MAG: DUF5060 domain-containing protein [Planctomycetota bacterium]